MARVLLAESDRRIRDFIAGILAGWMQAGLVVDLVCDSNLWLGVYGLMFLPLALFQKKFGPLIGAALETAGFATSGSKVTDNVSQSVNETGASLSRLGVVALVKIHHEVFFTFLAGIVSEPGVVSGDVIISDNSFEICAQAGISWSTLPLGKTLGKLLPPNHVVERNTMNIQGIGVRCRCVDGVFRSNAIRCPQIGFDLTCFSGRVQENTVDGTATQSNAGGLITLAPLRLVEEGSSFRVSGNRLQSGQGHGIFVNGNLARLVVEDNLIRGMAQNGITTATSALLQTVRISGNDILGCKAGRGIAPFDGAIILWEVQTDMLVQGNRLLGNRGIGMNLNLFAQWKNVALRLRVQENSQDGDGSTQMVTAVGDLIQFIGNQCTEGQTLQTAVTLTGHLVVANGNTVYSTQLPSAAVPSLLLFAVGSVPPAASAIATSNILNGSPQNIGFAVTNFVTSNNISL